MRPIKRVAEVGYRNNERLPLGLIVKEQVGLGQMLVCYESILTGESRAILVVLTSTAPCEEKFPASPGYLSIL